MSTSRSTGSFVARQVAVKSPIELTEEFAARTPGPRSVGSFASRQISRKSPVETVADHYYLEIALTLPPETTVERATKVMETLKGLIGNLSEFDRLTLGRPGYFVDETRSRLDGRTVRLTISTADRMMESDWADLVRRVPNSPGLTVRLFTGHDVDPILQTAA